MTHIDIIKHNLPGAVLSVSTPGSPIHHYVSGYAEIEKQIPFSSSHIVQNGKITRIFTAVLILKLLEQGFLDLDTPLEWIAQQNRLDGGRLNIIVDLYPYLKPLTLRELLNHTSGLPSYDKTLNYHKAFLNAPKKVWKIEAYLDLITGSPVRYQLGYEVPTRGFFSDSKTNYLLLGLVLESVTGRRSSDQMKDLFQQYGLENSHYSIYGQLDPKLLNKVAHGYLPLSHPDAPAFKKLPVHTYNNNRELQVYDVTSAYTTNGLSGSASLSNTTDLIHWIKLLLSGKVLKSSLHELFSTVPVTFTSEDKDFYGLGIYKTLTPRYGEIVWSAGNNYGYGVLIAHAIKRDITFALALNVSRQRIDLHNKDLVAGILKKLLG